MCSSPHLLGSQSSLLQLVVQMGLDFLYCRLHGAAAGFGGL